MSGCSSSGSAGLTALTGSCRAATASPVEQATAREVIEETGVEVEVGELVCSLVWERDHDRRRNLLAFFRCIPTRPEQEPRPQIEEDIDAAAYQDPRVVDPLHPLERPVLERWLANDTTPFHLWAEISVDANGAQSYDFRPDAS
jgi:hypothetical protein